MSPSETTQLVSTLQGVLSAAKAIAVGVPRAWWEVWAAPAVSAFITAVGRGIIVWANQKNNRDLIELQTKEQARTRILDALDDYAEYLRDLEFPRMVILRDEAMHCRVPLATNGPITESVETRVNPDAIEGAMASLTLFDTRETRWRSVLHHCSWVYGQDTEMSQKVVELMSAHETIMGDQTQFWVDLEAKRRKSKSALVSFLERERSPEAKQRIDEQFDRIHDIRSELNTPHFFRSHRTRKERSPSG